MFFCVFPLCVHVYMYVSNDLCQVFFFNFLTLCMCVCTYLSIYLSIDRSMSSVLISIHLSIYLCHEFKRMFFNVYVCMYVSIYLSQSIHIYLSTHARWFLKRSLLCYSSLDSNFLSNVRSLIIIMSELTGKEFRFTLVKTHTKKLLGCQSKNKRLK